VSKVKMKNAAGKDAGSVELPDAIFGVEPNAAVMHQVVTAQLAAARAGTHSTKTRAEVRGGGAKPWRQKGTGRARQGSIRATQWRGGGIAHGPKPRDYSQRTPKKMVRLALLGALSDRASESRVLVVDEWGWEAPRTKDAIAALGDLGIRTAKRSSKRARSAESGATQKSGEKEPRLLLVLDRTDEAAWKSFRNLGERVRIILPEELNTYDVLVSDWVVFTKATLETTVARLAPADGGAPEAAAALVAEAEAEDAS
jgi:large subunit ribosomal protein L4